MHETGSPSIDAHRKYGVRKWAAGTGLAAEESVAEEVPVALVYNGITHTVMLASPQDLEDFAVGFSLSECIAERRGDIYDVEIVERHNGIEARIEIAAARAFALKEHRRTLAGRTGCGLCGAESLDQVGGRAAPVVSSLQLTPAALVRAQLELAGRQQLFDLTGAVHAAAWCDADGGIALVREDVGRHNALDKLIGAIARSDRGCADGFVLLTSRASFEMVQKAAAVGIAVVAAISAPTGMAIRVADESGVTLIGFSRGDRHNIYAHPERVH